MGKKLWYTCVEILEEFKISNIVIANYLRRELINFWAVLMSSHNFYGSF